MILELDKRMVRKISDNEEEARAKILRLIADYASPSTTKKQDHIDEFIKSSLIVTKNQKDRLVADELFSAYKMWADSSGYVHMGKYTFYKVLESTGQTWRIKGNFNVLHFCNLKAQNNDVELDDDFYVELDESEWEL